MTETPKETKNLLDSLNVIAREKLLKAVEGTQSATYESISLDDHMASVVEEVVDAAVSLLALYVRILATTRKPIKQKRGNSKRTKG
jgi:hypothetical protein